MAGAARRLHRMVADGASGDHLALDEYVIAGLAGAGFHRPVVAEPMCRRRVPTWADALVALLEAFFGRDEAAGD